MQKNRICRQTYSAQNPSLVHSEKYNPPILSNRDHLWAVADHSRARGIIRGIVVGTVPSMSHREGLCGGTTQIKRTHV